MVRRTPKPDKRLDWRDPDMLVIREYIDENDKLGVELVPPRDVSQEARRDMVEACNPNWRLDPSYDWGKGKRRRRR